MELPDVAPQQTSSSKKVWFVIFTVIVLAVSGWVMFKVLGGKMPAGTDNNSQTTEAGKSDLSDYIDFAENLTIALNNISYMNQSEQRADLAEYMADDLLTSYQKYFYDPDFQRLVADRKIYITFQKIQRSTVETHVGFAVAVKVIGYNTYRSEISQTQLEVPFTLFLQIEKRPDGRLYATKLKKA